eukprot:Hpha_TRINITY_DN2965_c0_g1::TRINITY_DN2965_c0_g1_i1::g.19650::m.19650/K06662/HRAD17, RAD24; cell cycle checkpoint protein
MPETVVIHDSDSCSLEPLPPPEPTATKRRKAGANNSAPPKKRRPAQPKEKPKEKEGRPGLCVSTQPLPKRRPRAAAAARPVTLSLSTAPLTQAAGQVSSQAGHSLSLSQSLPASSQSTSAPPPVQSPAVWCPHSLLARYAPTSLQELASSKARNEDVANWFRCRAQGTEMVSPVLLICGPSGSGKKSLLSAAAAVNGFAVRMWEEHQDFGETCSADVSATVSGLGTGEYRVWDTQLDLFRRHITSGRAPAREVVGEAEAGGDTRRHVCVVNGLPSCFTVEQRKARDQTLTELAQLPWRSVNTRLAPVVVLHTVHDTHSTKFQLRSEYPKEFLDSPTVSTVYMKEVSDAQLRKRLKLIVSRESMDRVTPAVLESIVTGAQGDIRQAVHQLCFLAIRPSPRPAFQYPMPGTVTQREAGEGVACCDDEPKPEKGTATTREVRGVDVGHGCARTLSAKRDTDGQLNHSAEETLRLVGVPPSKMLDYVHGNLLRYCKVPDAVELMQVSERRLSEAESYLSALRDNQRFSDTAGWAARLAFRWGVDAYRHRNRAPSRPSGFEPSHPPPAFTRDGGLQFRDGREGRSIRAGLRPMFESAFDSDFLPHLSVRNLGTEFVPGMAGVMLKEPNWRFAAPAAGGGGNFGPFRPPTIPLYLTGSQVTQLREMRHYSRQWLHQNVPLQLSAKWEKPEPPHEHPRLSLLEPRGLVEEAQFERRDRQGRAEREDDPIGDFSD